MDNQTKKFTIDSAGNLVDEYGRTVELKPTYEFHINSEKQKKKPAKSSKSFMKSKKADSGFSRSHFFDDNLPKKVIHNQKTKQMVSTSTPHLIPEIKIVPSLEWWDKPFISEFPPISLPNLESLSEPQALDSIISVIPELVIDKEILNREKDPPKFVEGVPQNTTSHTVTMYLTPAEKKKLKRIKKAEKLKEIRDKIKLGLIEPPPQKIKLSNMMKVMASELVKDPTKTEQEVIEQYNKRQQKHQERNEQNKLDKKGKIEKSLRRLKRDSARELRTVLIRIPFVKSIEIKAKITKNAKENALVGYCFLITQGKHSIVVAEGGKRALKIFKRLCVHRIQWENDEKAEVVWESEIFDINFSKFKMLEADERQAKNILAEKNLLHYWTTVYSS